MRRHPGRVYFRVVDMRVVRKREKFGSFTGLWFPLSLLLRYL